MELKTALEERLKKFREVLTKKGLDGALVTKRENYMYLSGFTGTSAFLIITQEHAVLLTDFRYVEQAAAQAPLFKIEKYQGNIISALNEVIKSQGIEKLGFEEGNVTFEKYNEFVTKLGIRKFIPLESAIEKLRAFKDQFELEVIKKAVKIADDAFTHILPYIKPGVTEIEIAAEMEYYMKKAGAISASFETIIASGLRSSMPHGVASDKKIEQGDSITLDFGAYYQHYCSDITRTVFLGQPKEEMKKIYNIVLEAQLKASEGAAAGLFGKDIDLIARDIIYKNGFEKNFGHGLGHSVGLEIHESPRFSPSEDAKIENGMVITVEPGIYVSGLGGVRIEDCILINDDKPVTLTQSTKEMIIL